MTVKIQALESSIELSITEEDLWSLIEMNPGKILLAVNDGDNGTDVTITPEDGLSVYKNKFQMFDTHGKKIFGVNASGRVLMYEMLEITGDGGEYIDLTSGQLSFNNSNDRQMGRLSCIEDMDGLIVLESKNGDIELKGDQVKIYGKEIIDLIDERILANN